MKKRILNILQIRVNNKIIWFNPLTYAYFILWIIWILLAIVFSCISWIVNKISKILLTINNNISPLKIK